MDKCEMCGATVYSITNRRVGDHQFCRDCGDDIVFPIINAMNDGQIIMLKKQFEIHGREEMVKRTASAVAQFRV